MSQDYKVIKGFQLDEGLGLYDYDSLHNKPKIIKTINNIGPDEAGNIDITISEGASPDLSGYATQSWVEENYATKQYVDDQIAQAQLGGSNGEIDLSQFVTEEELTSAVDEALEAAKQSGDFKGEPGEPGRGIVSIKRTSGIGAAGTTDIYTITYTDGTTSTFSVYNGANGTGSDGSGENGATFTPHVDADGNLYWTNDKGLQNPESVNIMGPKPIKEIDYWTDSDKQEIVNETLNLVIKNFTNVAEVGA